MKRELKMDICTTTGRQKSELILSYRSGEKNSVSVRTGEEISVWE